ncbi:luciferase-like monooxygenase family protein [Mycobacterium kansasii]|uniref:Luciferase-like monooxygenase family protein n=1 Tax=Mycobacterium kansasii TaxID=1768 RepID=A0A1V3WMG7_MYCKA|nr:luciferase-like monooxygenase family protein [Mycobacterium kansasii]
MEPILEATTTLQVATGIVNIWSAPAKPVAESFHRIERAYPGRFLLGIGVGHSEATAEYRNPQNALAAWCSTWTSWTSTACRPTDAWWRPWVPGCSSCRPNAAPGPTPT